MPTSKVKFPEITVQLTNAYGSRLALVTVVKKALRIGGVSKKERNEFVVEALAGSYDDLLQVCREWVDVT